MILTILGRIPSKKNSTLTFARGGRVIHIPSNDYRKWHKDATRQLSEIKLPTNIPLEKANITMTLFAPDNRAGDLTNKAESLMDLLVDCGYLQDDNWFICNDVHLLFGGVDKENPRAEIEII